MSLVRINPDPSKRQLLVFACAWTVAFGCLGWVLWRRNGHAGAEALWASALALPLAGAAVPRLLKWAYLGLSYATYPIGFVVSYVALALMYFGVLTPIGLVMRLLRYDPLTRAFDPKAKSYWVARDGPRPAESYFNQS